MWQIGRGVAAAPGESEGIAAITLDTARKFAEAELPYIMVVSHTDPSMTALIAASCGVITAKGGVLSHAAITCRAWGKAAVCGVPNLRLVNARAWVGGTQIEDRRSVLIIDGNSGAIFAA